VADSPNDGLVPFFPSRGDWSWVRTMRNAPGGDRADVWRFGAAETRRAIGEGGPVCRTLDTGGGEIGPVSGTLGFATWVQFWRNEGRRPWRRARGTRFVPPGAPIRSPVFVEWRREDGRWVVSALGDEDYYAPRVLGEVVEQTSRDTALVPEGLGYAAAERWYIDNEPMLFAGSRYVKYGLPRPLDRAEVQRVGVRGRVSLYAEAGQGGPYMDVLYIAVSPGQYQPYQYFGNGPCR
jgi:hypothetical protein